MEVPEPSGKYEYRTGQAHDEGFLTHRLEPEIRPAFGVIFHQIISKIVKLARMLDVPINVVSTATFRQFISKLVKHGIEISHLAPDIPSPRR
jgi:hypothetical protein